MSGFGGRRPPYKNYPMWYVYILKCVDGTHYVGCTSNFKQRFAAHKKGNVKSTKHKLPIELIICAAI